MRIFVAWAPTASPSFRARRSSRGARPARAGSRLVGTEEAPLGVRISGVGRLVRRKDVRQGIDVERADQARVEALEVEHEDVPVEAGDGVEDEASRDHRALGVLVDRGATRPRSRSSAR